MSTEEHRMKVSKFREDADSILINLSGMELNNMGILGILESAKQSVIFNKKIEATSNSFEDLGLGQILNLVKEAQEDSISGMEVVGVLTMLQFEDMTRSMYGDPEDDIDG